MRGSRFISQETESRSFQVIPNGALPIDGYIMQYHMHISMLYIYRERGI